MANYTSIALMVGATLAAPTGQKFRVIPSVNSPHPRPLSQWERGVAQRRGEGFSSLVVPASNAKVLDKVVAVGHVAEAVRKVFGDLKAPRDDRQ